MGIYGKFRNTRGSPIPTMHGGSSLKVPMLMAPSSCVTCLDPVQYQKLQSLAARRDELLDDRNPLRMSGRGIWNRGSH